MVETAQKYQTIPRLVIVSSEVHFFTTIDGAILENDNPLAMFGSSEQYVQRYDWFWNVHDNELNDLSQGFENAIRRLKTYV